MLLFLAIISYYNACGEEVTSTVRGSVPGSVRWPQEEEEKWR
jgi:hypothetical protein